MDRRSHFLQICEDIAQNLEKNELYKMYYVFNFFRLTFDLIFKVKGHDFSIFWKFDLLQAKFDDNT